MMKKIATLCPHFKMIVQVFQLESTFDLKRYLSSSERAGLAASLHLTETQVHTTVHLNVRFLAFPMSGFYE